MNCCNANGECTGGRNCPGRESQPQLRFAPGTVESYRRPWLGTPLQRRELVRWVGRLAGFGAVVVLAAFAAGVIAGRWP